MTDDDTSSPKAGGSKITKISGELREVKMASMDSAKTETKSQKGSKTDK